MLKNRRFSVGTLVVVAIVACVSFFAFRREPRNRLGRPGGGQMNPRPVLQSDATNPDPTSNDSVAKDLSGSESKGEGFLVATTSKSSSKAADVLVPWSRFRGNDGSGSSSDESIPVQWSDTSNLEWKVKLPGAGSSSPVLTDKFVFVTTYSGYGDAGGSAGKMNALQRQINCIDRKNGSLRWTKGVDAVLPEDPYQGMGVPEHGYATNSPTTDGKSVFAFFGKTGVYAFDMQGEELWHTSVGTESGKKGWGTAASLTLYRDLVIVNASEESQSIIALDKKTGKKVWAAPASILDLAYGTPVIIQVNEAREDLVLAVPGEVWGLNPMTGKLVWYVETSLTGNLSPSVIPDGDKVYVFGGYRSSGSLAIQVGGTGNVTKSNVLWTSRNSSYVVTPVLHEGTLFWIDDQGMFFSVSAKTGELIQKKRVSEIKSRGRPVYASPIEIAGKLYMQTRNGGLFVLAAEPNLNILSQNRFESDDSVFNATPTVSHGQLFIRSYSHLYCIRKAD